MAFRRRFRRFRRAGAGTRRRWDMQEYVECERVFTISTTNAFNCDTPLVFADMLASPASPSNSVVQSQGAGKGIVWGGCRGQFQYMLGVTINTDSSPPTDAICNLGINLMTAIVRLPLLNAKDPTPAYLPNLLGAKSQLSTFAVTQFDNVELVLWRRQERLRWAAYMLQADPGDSCWSVFNQASNGIQPGDGYAWIATVATSVGLFGRTWGRGEFRARVKCALDERMGIFLVRCISIGSPLGIDGGPDINLLSDSWVQFAVRPK